MKWRSFLSGMLALVVLALVILLMMAGPALHGATPLSEKVRITITSGVDANINPSHAFFAQFSQAFADEFYKNSRTDEIEAGWTVDIQFFCRGNKHNSDGITLVFTNARFRRATVNITTNKAGIKRGREAGETAAEMAWSMIIKLQEWPVKPPDAA